MATIKTLLEGTTKIAPRTKVKAVSDDNNVGLDAILDDKVDTDVFEERLGVSITLTRNGMLNIKEI